MDLVLHVQEAGRRPSIALDYNTSVICADQAVSVTETFKLIYSHIVQEKCSNLSELELCGKSDLDLLSKWNPGIPYQQPICVHEPILQQCVQNPANVAVDSWDGNLTYRDLDFLSAQLALYLVSLGVDTETLVPLCFEKSKWAIVAVLGVMRAGGAYAFLDPSCPVSRMIDISQDLKAKHLLCSTAQSAISDKLDLQTVIVSESIFGKECPPQQIINPSIQPHNAVYAAFSSGSTGRPKGVVIEHGAFYLRAMANKQNLSLSNQSRVMQFANYVFDVSNRDILYTLMFGGCICIPSDFDRDNNLTAFMAQKQINWASLTPSLTNLLEPNGVPHLSHLVLCGEPMTPLHIATWAGKVKLINAYGPSETTTISSVCTNMRPQIHHSNIGHGSGSAIWIVDPHDYNKLLPVGAVGELIIESPSIGRGYVNNSTETKASFLPAPNWISHFRPQSPPDRVYTTGDLGRYASDGSILFMGRKDSQVKIRGQRVELGEVEHHIQQSLGHDTNIPVVVDLVVPQGLKTALLVAFLPIMQNARTATTDAQAALHKLRPILENNLSKLLPAYMIPSEFVIVENIPMTTTGKKNRRQLREKFATLGLDELNQHHISEGNEKAPTSDLERRLQQIWASVLEIPANNVKSNDSFFRLGGDSIAAMRVAARTRSEGLDLSVADMLEYKQLDRLANVLLTRPRIDTAVRFTPFALTDSETMTKLPARIEQLLASNLIADIVPVTESQIFFLTQWSLSSFRLLINGHIDVDRLRFACQTTISQHSSLRAIFTKVGNRIFQAFLKEITVPFEHIHTDQSFEFVCQATTDNDLTESPLSGNPLIKFTLISRSEEEHALMVRLSHAQYDGYSSPVLFRSISSAYNCPEKARSLPLPTPYSHYVYACNQQRTKEAFEFWRKNLLGSSMSYPPVLPSQLNHQDGCITDIRQGASGKLPHAPQELTVPTLMNATLSVVLSQILQKDDVVFGVVMNTRDISLQGVESMLGSCININPFRVNLKPSPTQTVLDLCHSLHDQYVQVSRYSYLDLSDIVANSTDWPRETKLGFMINHLDGAKQPIPLTLDGAPCDSSSWTARISLVDQVLIRSVTTKDELQVQVLTSDKVMSTDSASGLARKLVHTAQILSNCTNNPLSSLNLEDSQ